MIRCTILSAAPSVLVGLAIVCLPSAALARTEFVIQPYLQHVTTGRAQVRFLTDEPVASTVDVRGAGKMLQFREPSASEFHDMMLDGLEPATTYTYQVRAGDAVSAPAELTTAPSDPTRPFTFLVAGDNRDGSDVYADLVRCMLRIPSSFVVHTGDVVARGRDRDAWEEYFRVAQPLLSRRPQYVAMGNHDLSGRGAGRREPFLRYFASPDDPQASYYTFRWGNTRFFVLDTQEVWSGDQRPWLQDRLERADHEEGIAHRVVVVHHSPFSTGRHGPNREMREAGIVHLMLDHRVDLVLGGHDHMYERDQYGAMKYVISGGAGAPLYDVRPRSTGAAYAVSAYHFVEVHVDGDKVTVVARDAQGNPFDSAAYEGTGPWVVSAAPAAASASPRGSSGRLLQTLPPRGSSCGCRTAADRGAAHVWLTLWLMGMVALRYRRSRIS